MTIEEKIARVLANAGTCPFRVEQVIARLSSETPLSGGLAEWLRKIGVDDPRIEQALDESLSPEARAVMFRGLMSRYRLNNQATAAMLGCSVPLVAAYRSGQREIQIRRLMNLKKIIESIEKTRNNE